MLGPGEVAAFPVGPEGAHKVFNASEQPCAVPDALHQGRGRVHGLSRVEQDRQFGNGRERALVRLGENLDYYDGERP